MKLKRIAALLIAGSFLACGNAFAVGNIKAVNEERNVIISGYAEDSEAEPVKNAYTSVIVYTKEKTEDDINNEYNSLIPGENKDVLDTVVYMGVDKTDSEGNILFKFEMPEDAVGGKYNIVSYVGNQKYDTVMNYVRDNDKRAGVLQMNSALETSLDELVLLVDDENYSFFLSLFEGYKATREMFDVVKGKESFFALMKGKGDYDISTLNSSIELLNKNLDESILLSYAEEIDEPDALESYVEDIADVVGLDISGINEENKATVYGNLAELTDFDSVYKVKMSIIENVVIYDINNAFSWGSVKNVIEAYHEELGLDISGSNVDYDKVYHELFKMKNALTDTDKIKDAFLTVKAMCHVADTTNVPTGGGGGGGGGGGAVAKPNKSGVTSIPQVEIEEIINYPALVSPIPFTDVSETFWGYAEIKKLYEEGIVKGKTETEFEPDTTITREEFVAMLIRAVGIDAEESEKSFTDVPSDAWFYNAVQTAAAKGIVNGRENGSFGSGENITRQDMAVIVYNMSEKGLVDISYGNSLTFKDADKISDYATEAVAKISGAGIIKGYTEGDFRPSGKATRAEAAAIISRIIGK